MAALVLNVRDVLTQMGVRLPVRQKEPAHLRSPAKDRHVVRPASDAFAVASRSPASAIAGTRIPFHDGVFVDGAKEWTVRSTP